MKTQGLVVLCLFFSLNAVAKDKCPWKTPLGPLVTHRSELEPTIRNLSPKEIRQDLACLEQIFQNEYLAADYYKPRGIDLVARLRDFRSKIDAPHDQKWLAENLLALHDGARDFHMAYAYYDKDFKLHPVKQKAIAPFEVVVASGREFPVSCKGFQETPVLNEQGQARKAWIGHVEEDLSAVQCQLKDGSSEAFPIKKITPAPISPDASKFRYSINGDVLYVRIPDFQLDLKNLSPEQKDFLQILGEDKYKVIIDLRGNKGGDPHFAYVALSKIISKKQPLPEVQSIQKIGILSYAGLLNDMYRYLLNAKDAHNEQVYKSYKDMRRKYKLFYFLQSIKHWKLNRSKTHLEPYPGDMLTLTREEPYIHPVVVLTDKNTASAGEAIPAYASVTPGVYTIGAHTMGAVAFTAPGYFVLPRSHLAFRGGWYGLKTSILPEEGVGFAPKYYVEDGQDSLKAAEAFLRLIN